MDIIKRFFIVIWTIIFIALAFCGGFILFPLLAYIFKGNCYDPMVTTGNIWEGGQKLIESFFDNIKNNKYNGKFWK